MSSTTSNYPLLVKVQTIDINNLDFKSSAAFKTRNVTCVETSNLFLFVGVTSGTVYVFSRETLSFKFMIPFKGGKVCSISCAENERDIAIGSIRGHVSLYQIIDQPMNAKTSITSSPAAFFKYVNTLDHHKGNEIIELHWSTNGRYLFTGDSQGLVSQADVGSFEEFPRPVSFSQVILKLKSRIIQIQFMFPYLAVCTVSAVFLCDIENEDFTRIQFESKGDIQATGIALIIGESEPSVKAIDFAIYLYVSEMTSGLLYRFSLKGHLLESKKIEMNSFLTRNPVSVFDPILNEELRPIKGNNPVHNVSLGKLLLTDDNLFVSVSHNHIYLIHPGMMKLILWNDEFLRIQGAKLLSNYCFLWSGTKVHVLSLTQVLSYSEQLFRAGLMTPFERWIKHCLISIGYREKQDDGETERNVANHYRSLILANQSWSEESSFHSFISERIPFKLVENEEETNSTTVVSPLWKPLQNLLAAFEQGSNYCFQNPSNDDAKCSCIWQAIQQLYSEMNLSLNSPAESNHLAQVILRVETFQEEMNLVNLYHQLNTISVNNRNQEIIEDEMLDFIRSHKKSYSEGLTATKNLCLSGFQNLSFFSSFAKDDEVVEWFGNFGISKQELESDSLLADIILICSPFLPPSKRIEIVTEIRKLFSGFCIWLLTSTYFIFDRQSLYELQLKSLLSPTPPDFNYAKDILCSIYSDLVQTDLEALCACLPHVISILYFISSKDMASGQKIDKRKETTISLLLSCFPLKHWSKQDIEGKLFKLCKMNAILFEMFQEATLLAHSRTNLCQCGIPLNCFQISTQSETSSNSISSIQLISEEVILELLLQKFHQTNYKSEVPINLIDSVAFKFAMKMKLYEQYLSDCSCQMTDSLLIEIILRVSSCTLLETMGLTKSRLKILLKKLDSLLESGRCGICGDNLILPSNFQSFPVDCIGTWIFNNSSSLEDFIESIKPTSLNSSGKFTLRFYQLVAEWKDRAEKSKGRNVPTLSCNCKSFHM